MVHFPSHKRAAFQEYLNAWRDARRSPATATVEVNYEPTTVNAQEFLHEFLNCDDIIPRDVREHELALVLGDDGGDPATYAEAAHLLLERMTPEREEYAVGMPSILGGHVSMIEYAREELQRAKRAHRRVEPWTRERAAENPDTLRAWARAIEAGELEYSITDVEITIHAEFSRPDGGERVGRAKISGMDYGTLEDFDIESFAAEGADVDFFEEK